MFIMAIDLNLILFSPEELRKIVVGGARAVVPKENSASQVAFERVSGERVSDWDYQIAFSVLKERESRVVRDIILEVAREYNLMIKDIRKSYPEFSRISWNSFRMIGSFARSPALSSLFKTETDEYLARFCSRQQVRDLNFDEDASVFEYWNGFDLKDYDRNFLFGVGKYKFVDKHGHKLESIWDFRQEKLPNFVYAKEL